jgi:polyferredoxin
MTRPASLMQRLIARRRLVQLALALAVLGLFAAGRVTLTQVIVFGAALGIVFGKVFCRWMCPMGLLMEVLLGASGDGRNEQMYLYHKLGCPIAWVSGLLNRVSLLRVRRDAASCIDCGKCDKVCYIATLDQKYSHYKEALARPTASFSCSRCLDCVKACPTGSLGYGVGRTG